MDVEKRTNELVEEAMIAVDKSGKWGYEAAEVIRDFMLENDHPHATYSMNEMWDFWNNGEEEDENVILRDVAGGMAWLVAQREFEEEMEINRRKNNG